METPVNLLRKQVAAERRKKRLIFFTVTFLIFAYVFVSFLFGDMGLFRYKELYKTRTHLEAQIKELERDNLELRAQIKSIKDDPYMKEKHAREDYGLARPDELIFQYDR